MLSALSSTFYLQSRNWHCCLILCRKPDIFRLLYIIRICDCLLSSQCEKYCDWRTILILDGISYPNLSLYSACKYISISITIFKLINSMHLTFFLTLGLCCRLTPVSNCAPHNHLLMPPQWDERENGKSRSEKTCRVR